MVAAAYHAPGMTCPTLLAALPHTGVPTRRLAAAHGMPSHAAGTHPASDILVLGFKSLPSLSS